MKVMRFTTVRSGEAPAEFDTDTATATELNLISDVGFSKGYIADQNRDNPYAMTNFHDIEKDGGDPRIVIDGLDTMTNPGGAGNAYFTGLVMQDGTTLTTRQELEDHMDLYKHIFVPITLTDDGTTMKYGTTTADAAALETFILDH